MKKMKVVFSVFSVLGILAIGGFSISCSPNHITQYSTVYGADKITVSGDKSCNKLKQLFANYKLSAYKYGNKYVAGFTVIDKNTDTVPTYVSISDNTLYIWLRDNKVIDISGVGVVANASFNTYFDVKTKSMPHTLNVFWSLYFNGDLICNYQVEAINVGSGATDYSKHSNGNVYDTLKTYYETVRNDYLAVK
jgi:hypothetical protein